MSNLYDNYFDKYEKVSVKKALRGVKDTRKIAQSHVDIHRADGKYQRNSGSIKIETAFGLSQELGNSRSDKHSQLIPHDEAISKEFFSMTSYPSFTVKDFEIDPKKVGDMIDVTRSSDANEFAKSLSKMRNYFKYYGGMLNFTTLWVDQYARSLHARFLNDGGKAVLHKHGPCFRVFLYYFEVYGGEEAKARVSNVYGLASGSSITEYELKNFMSTLKSELDQSNRMTLFLLDEHNIFSNIMFLAEVADFYLLEHQHAFAVMMEMIDENYISYTGLQMIMMISELILKIGDSPKYGNVEVIIDKKETDLTYTMRSSGFYESYALNIKKYLIRKFNMNWVLSWEICRLSGINKRNIVVMKSVESSDFGHFGDYFSVNGERLDF